MSNAFTLVRDGDADNPQLNNVIISRNYPNPKIYTKAIPAHIGNIYLNWKSSIAIAQNTTKLIDSFPHGFQYVPTVFGTFKFDNGSVKQEGVLAFSYGALGVITIDADIANINLKYFSTDLGGADIIPPFTMQIRYYVLVERGQ